MHRLFSHRIARRVSSRRPLLCAATALAALLLAAAVTSGNAGAALPATVTATTPSVTATPALPATPHQGMPPTASPSSLVAPSATATGTPAPTATVTASPAPAAAPVLLPTATATPAPVPTALPAPAATPLPAAAPTPPPAVDDSGLVYGYAVTGAAAVYAAPSTGSAVVGSLAYEQPVALLAEVSGERVVVGDQDWPMALQDWSDQWYAVDGGYVYSAYIWIPRPGELLPEQLGPGVRRVDVDLASQTASLLIDDVVVYTAPVTTGKPGYRTPTGTWHVQYQVLNEVMTSSQAGIIDPAERYDVENVLFTQYFDGDGDALHLNYWQPESTFGNRATSHGCVGLFIQDAQYFWLFGEPGMAVTIH